MKSTRYQWLRLAKEVQEEETSTYSAMMREINKNQPEIREEFMRKFKDAFDRAMEQNLEDHQTIALMEAKKSLGSNINYRLYSLGQIMMSSNPTQVGQSLAQVVKVLLSRVPHDKAKAYGIIRNKILSINPGSLSSQDFPATASYGQAITLIKTMLYGYDLKFVTEALNSLVKNLK